MRYPKRNMRIVSFQITGTGAVQTFQAAIQPGRVNAIQPLSCKWLQATAATGASMLIGGPEVTSTVGFTRYPLPTGVTSQFLPPISEIQ